MTLELQFVETACYLKVVARGLCTDQNSVDAIRKVIAALDRSAADSLLIDIHEMLLDSNVLTDAGVGNFISDSLGTRKHGIAVLGNSNSQEDHRFLESIANSNKNNIRFFYEESQAMDWLMPDSDNP